MRRGITLLEVLISSGLFLLALVLCGELAMAGIRTRSRNSDRNGAFRQTVTLFHQLQRDLQDCKQVYLPDIQDLNAHQPGRDSAPLILRNLGPDGTPQVISWMLAGEQLSRTLYRTDFDPLLPATHLALADQRPLKCLGVGRFLLVLEPPGNHYGNRLLRVELDCAKPAQQKLIAGQRLSF